MVHTFRETRGSVLATGPSPGLGPSKSWCLPGGCDSPGRLRGSNAIVLYAHVPLLSRRWPDPHCRWCAEQPRGGVGARPVSRGGTTLCARNRCGKSSCCERSCAAASGRATPGQAGRPGQSSCCECSRAAVLEGRREGQSSRCERSRAAAGRAGRPGRPWRPTRPEAPFRRQRCPCVSARRLCPDVAAWQRLRRRLRPDAAAQWQRRLRQRCLRPDAAARSQSRIRRLRQGRLRQRRFRRFRQYAD